MKTPYRIIAILQISMVAFLILLTLGVFFPLQRELSDRVLNLKNDLIRVLEDSIGREIQFSSIHPSIFSYIEIRNLVIYDQDIPVVAIDRLLLRYDIREILRGNPLSAPRQIELRGGNIVADSFFDGSESGTGAAIQMDKLLENISDELVIVFRNIEIAYSHPSVEIRHLINRGEMSYLQGQISLTLRNSTALTLISETGQVLTASSASRFQGELDLPDNFITLEDARESLAHLTVSLDNLESRNFTVTPISLYVSYNAGDISISSLEGRLPFEFEAEYSPEVGSLHAVFNSQEWVPSSLLRVRNSWSTFAPYLETVISAGLDATMDDTGTLLDSQGWLSLESWLPEFDGNIAADLQYRFDGNSLAMDFARLSTEAGDNLSLSGTVDPRTRDGSISGTATIASRSSFPSVSTDLSVTVSGDRVLGNFAQLNIGELEFNDTSVELQLGSVETRASLITHPVFSGGLVTVSASTGPIKNGIQAQPVEVSVDLSSMDIAGLVSAAESFTGTSFAGYITELTGSQEPGSSGYILNTRATGEFTPGGRLDDITLFLQTLTLDDRQGITRFSANGRMKNSVILMPRIELNLPGTNFSTSVQVDVSRAGIADFHSDFALNELEMEIDGRYSDSRLSAKASYGTLIDFHYSPLDRTIIGELSFEDLPMEVAGGIFVSASTSALIPVDDPMASIVRFKSVDFRNLSLFPLPDDRRSRISLSGEGDSSGIRLSSVIYLDFISSISGSGDISIIDDGVITADLLLSSSQEQYRLQAGYTNGDLEGVFTLVNLPTRRIGLEDIIGLIQGTVGISGSLDDPMLNFSLAANDARFSSDRISLRVNGTANLDNITLNDSSVETSSVALRSATANLDLNSGQVDFQGNLLTADGTGGKQFFRRLVGAVSVPAIGRDNSPAVDDTSSSFVALTQDMEGAFSLQKQDETATEGIWNFTVGSSADGLIFGGGMDGALNSLNLQISSDGSFTGASSAPLPVNFVVDGFLEGSNIDATVRGLEADLPELAGNSDSDLFNLSNGNVEGSLRITGSIVDPDFFGTVAIRDTALKLSMIDADIEIPMLFLILEEKNLYIPTFDMNYTGGSAEIEGSVVFDRWGLSDVIVQLNTGEDYLPIAYDFSGLYADASLKGILDLEFDALHNALSIKGDLLAEGALEMGNSSNSSGSAQNSDMDVNIDMRITTGRKVEFYWPSRTIPILRVAALNGETLLFQMGGPPSWMKINGDIALRSGEIFYFDQSFYVREGELRLNETEAGFDPILSLSAEARGTDGTDPVKIYLDILEDRFSQLQPRFTSDPVMSESEILALLGGRALNTEDGEDLQIADALLSGSEFISQISVFKQIEDEMRNRFNLDVFSIRTGLFQNILQDVIVNSDSQASANESITLGKYLENTTLVLGRYIGDSVYSEAVFSLQEKSALDRAADDLIGLTLDFEFGLEWETPFFDLRWSLLPENPENLFVTDQKFTFSRSFTPGK